MDELRIDQLPYLCLKRIFKHLSIKDLAKCRAVNRLFKFYAEDTALVELIAVESYWWVEREHWFLTNRPLNFDNEISWEALSCFKSSPFTLDQLKFLQICLWDADVNCELLNRFKQLVQLEICMPSEGHSTKTLDLPNLKVLWFYQHGSYVLKTPKLEALKCQAVDRFQFDHPETIKQLECTRMSNQTTKFKNLKVLKCESLGIELTAKPLSDWNELTELAIEHSGHSSGVDYEAFESWMVNLMRQRDALRRAVKIFLDDVSMVDVNQLSEREFMPRHIFQFKNHRLLRRESYPEQRNVCFNDLVDFGVELSSDFFVRFPAIGFILARGSIDPDAFEYFLKNAKSVYSLELVGTSLDQSFFDRLPSINSQLTKLSMWDTSHLVTNFDFILQFKQLAAFSTDHQFNSFEFVAKAYRQLYDLYHLYFRAGDEEVFVFHHGPIKNNYELSFSLRKGGLSLRTFSRDNLKLSELVTLYDQLSVPAAQKARKEWADGVDIP